MFIIKMYFISLAPVRRLNRRGVVNEKVIRMCSDPLGTPSLRDVFGCLKHPPNPEFVVQRSVNTMERLCQWVCDFSFFREFFEKSLQALERPSAQVKANRVAANPSLVEPQPVRRRNLHSPAFQSCMDGFLLLNRRHGVLRRRILHFY